MARLRGEAYLNSSEKRALDLIGGTVAALALAPVAAPTGVAAMLDTRSANPFFRQERVGKNGLTFMCTKFRTLRKASLGDAFETFGVVDPRASKLGQVLRSYGLDEIPQVLDVLSGRMSMVGIRPFPQPVIDTFAERAPEIFDYWYNRSLTVGKPGITGLSQLDRHYKMADERLPQVYTRSIELDNYYVENASLGMDLRIMARTPLTLVRAALGSQIAALRYKNGEEIPTQSATTSS